MASVGYHSKYCNSTWIKIKFDHRSYQFLSFFSNKKRVDHLKFNCAVNKRTLAYFSKFIALFAWVVEHDFIQMAYTARLTIPDSINSIFKHIFECFCFKLTNSNADFLFRVLNRLWVFSVTFSTAFHTKKSNGVKSRWNWASSEKLIFLTFWVKDTPLIICF